MRRALIGILAVVLLSAWGVLFWSDLGAEHETAIGFCLKLGAFLAVLWLALPDAERPRNRMWMAFILISVVILAIRPKLFPLAIVVFLALALLRPRKPRSPVARS